MCSSLSRPCVNVVLGAMMSSMYTRHSCHCIPRSTFSMRRSKVEGEFAKPKGITVNWYKPRLVLNYVFSSLC